MLRFIVIFLIVLAPLVSYSQKYSKSIDSLTSGNIALLPKKKQAYFTNVLEQRKKIKWQTRTDSLDYDYAFIEETFCSYDTTSTITERYFSKNDSIPKAVYINGIKEDVRKIYDYGMRWYSKNVTHYETLMPLLTTYSKLADWQELPYDKRQVWHHGCVVFEDEKDFKKRRINQLKNTYQIQTLIDKGNNKTLVCAQLAPKNPRFEVKSYNGEWDW